jgi:hypothetical protein
VSKSLTEVQTSAGEIFLPLVSHLANVANDELVPALAAMVEKSGPELAASLAESVPSMVQFLETLIPMLPQLLKLGTDALPLFIGGMTVLLPALEYVTKVQNDWVRGLGFLFSLIAGDETLDDLHQTVAGLQGPFAFSPAERGPLAGSGWNDLTKSGSAALDQFASGFTRPDLTAVLTPTLASVAPAVSSHHAMSASIGGAQTVRLVVGKREFDAYVEEMADGRVAAADARSMATAARGTQTR